jgi:hypothetical protein
MAWTASGGSLSSCGSEDVVSQVISPSTTVRVFATGQTQINSTGGDVALSVAIVSGSSVLGEVTMGDAIAAPTTATPMLVSGVLLNTSTPPVPLELPPGTYDIRFRMAKTTGCPGSTLTATRPMLSVVTLGTTP